MSGKYLSPPDCPFTDIGELLLEIEKQEGKIGKYSEYINLSDRDYYSFNEFRRRVPKDLNLNYCWWLTRLLRDASMISLAPLGNKPLPPNLPDEICKALLNSPDFTQFCRFNYLHEFTQTLSQIDRYTTDSAMLSIIEQIGETAHFTHLTNSLIDEEAISSSQLEGAATTTILAKEMIRKNRTPRTDDERMIAGNFDLMQAAWNLKNEPLSIGLIKELHKVGTLSLNQDKYTSGLFRLSDDVAVVNSDGEIVHLPPKQNTIEALLSKVVSWLNSNNDDIHPVIKAITLHFVVGYIHPFRDANGRVARAIFYWYLFKSGYSGFRYIAISALLKKAPIQYGISYVDSEHDNLDLTYFIKYQLKVINRAINEFINISQRAAKRMSEVEKQYVDLEELDKKIIGLVAGEPRHKKKPSITAREAEKLLNLSYNTVKQKLDDMVKAGILNREKIGKATEYFLN